MSGDRLRRRVLGLYPGWWRERYADEVEVCSQDLIEGGRSSWVINFGLFWGALRTRLSAQGMPATPELWAARARGWLVVATAPVLVVVPFFVAVHQPRPVGAQATGWPARVTADAYLVLILCFFVLLIAALWGYGSLSAGLEGGSGRSRTPALLTRAPGRLTLLAFVLFVVSVVVGPHNEVIAHGQPPVWQGGSPDIAAALRWAALAALVAGWAMVVPVLSTAVRRGAFSPWLWRSGRRVSRTITAVLWLMAVAAAADQIANARLAAMHESGVPLTVFGASLWLLVGVLGGAAIVSSWGTTALSRSLRMGRSLTTV